MGCFPISAEADNQREAIFYIEQKIERQDSVHIAFQQFQEFLKQHLALLLGRGPLQLEFSITKVALPLQGSGRMACF